MSKTINTYEALGWMYAHMCTLLDQGKDPRDIEVPEIFACFEADVGKEGCPDCPLSAPITLRELIERQAAWREKKVPLDYAKIMASKLGEFRETPSDLCGWISIIMMAIDWALREGYTPEQIAYEIETRQAAYAAARSGGR